MSYSMNIASFAWRNTRRSVTEIFYEKTKCKNYDAICSKCVSIYEVIVGRWNKPKRRRLFKKHRLTCVYVIESTLARVTQYIRCPCMGSLHLATANHTQFLWLFRHCFRLFLISRWIHFFPSIFPQWLVLDKHSFFFFNVNQYQLKSSNRTSIANFRF